jgi:hypothetical protein
MTYHNFNKLIIVKVLVVVLVNNHPNKQRVDDGMLLKLTEKIHQILIPVILLINVVEVVFLVIIIIEMVVIIMAVMEDNVIIIMVDVIMNLINHFIHMLVVNRAMQPVLIGVHHYPQMLILKGK